MRGNGCCKLKFKKCNVTVLDEENEMDEYLHKKNLYRTVIVLNRKIIYVIMEDGEQQVKSLCL